MEFDVSDKLALVDVTFQRILNPKMKSDEYGLA